MTRSVMGALWQVCEFSERRDIIAVAEALAFSRISGSRLGMVARDSSMRTMSLAGLTVCCHDRWMSGSLGSIW